MTDLLGPEKYERAFDGVWIPAEIWLDPNLTIIEKVMLVEVRSLAKTANGCWAGNRHFASFFQLSKSRVSEVINALVEKGYFSVEMEMEGKLVRKRTIHLLPPFGIPNTPPSESRTGYSEKAKVNSTNSNIPRAGAKALVVSPGQETYSQRFEDVWKSWVKGKGGSKADAYKAWLKRNLDHPDHSHVAVMILHDVQTRATSHRQWLDGFPPHMSTYLNKSGWTADIDTSTGTRTNGRAKTSYEQVMEASERNRAALREDYDNLSPDEQRDFRAAFGH